MQPRISFRPLRESDFNLMHRWLNMPHVIEWWDKTGASFNEIRSKYLPRISGDSPVSCFVIEMDNRDIGYIQTYWVSDFIKEIAQLCPQMVEQAASLVASLDVFIGEPDLLNSGLGTRAVRQFLNQVVFGKMKANSCIVTPDSSNSAAIRVYKKAGFSLEACAGPSGAFRHHYLMSCLNPAS
ncbi:MAG: GNAT family N-acetyltransferase [Candidatus Melainabacteria bacterium]|nr:MAG: GNAT family N-acetyltransferase [Candidatus Melainabacteria bacterium]